MAWMRGVRGLGVPLEPGLRGRRGEGGNVLASPNEGNAFSPWRHYHYGARWEL